MSRSHLHVLHLQLTESEARRFFQQLVSGIECCHLNNIVHRDLKPENLLLDSHNNIKIADFGFANIVRDGYLFSTSCGSKNYAAPEIIDGRIYSGPEVDIWSCGVILYALVYGRLPFDEESIPLLFKRIKLAEYTLRATISFEARSMISRLLVANPLKRATIKEIRYATATCDSINHIYCAQFVADTMEACAKFEQFYSPFLLINIFSLAENIYGSGQPSHSTSASRGNQIQKLVFAA